MLGIIFFHVSMKVLSTSGVAGTSAAVENTRGLVDRKRRRPALAARRNTFDVRQIEQQRRRSGEELREINGGAFFRVWRVGVQMACTRLWGTERNQSHPNLIVLEFRQMIKI